MCSFFFSSANATCDIVTMLAFSIPVASVVEDTSASVDGSDDALLRPLSFLPLP
jgi:hypothetical protein